MFKNILLSLRIKTMDEMFKIVLNLETSSIFNIQSQMKKSMNLSELFKIKRFCMVFSETIFLILQN